MLGKNCEGSLGFDFFFFLGMSFVISQTGLVYLTRTSVAGKDETRAGEPPEREAEKKRASG